jgi:hypothetical protein
MKYHCLWYTMGLMMLKNTLSRIVVAHYNGVKMSKVPNDIKKANQKAEELAKDKGELFSSGFISYMIEVDYKKKDPERVLYDLVAVLHSSRFIEEREAMLSGEVESDVVKGFEYAKQYSQEVNYTYRD